LGIEDGAAPRQVRKSLELGNSIYRGEFVKHAGLLLFRRRSLSAALQIFVRRICYEALALLPRHSFAERNRIQGQKPL